MPFAQVSSSGLEVITRYDQTIHKYILTKDSYEVQDEHHCDNGLVRLISFCLRRSWATNSPDSEQIVKANQDLELGEEIVNAFGCKKATSALISLINLGNTKKENFLQSCARATGGSAWCDQLIRPNPSSVSTFHCTYNTSQVHQLINPNEVTWKNAFEAVILIQELERIGLRVCQIYNWWRPEPYNQNVGGAPGRHPFGTSVDVRFCSNGDADRAFNELCKFRKAGKIRAIGHYGTSALHFGIGDSMGNTWGKSCPR